MQPRRNRLGFLALVVGALALIAVMAGRHGGPSVLHQPAAADRIAAQAERQAARAEAQAFRLRERAEQVGGNWERRAEARAERWQNDHRPFFLGPLFFVGNLVRVIAALLLIGFGVRLLRRSGWRGPGRGPDAPGGPGTPVGPVFHA